MLKDRLLKLLPKPEKLRENRALKPVAHLLQRKELWQVNRRSVSSAVFVGLFCAFIPVPSQMLLAAIISVFMRANLPLSVALVWITNPITMAPMFYFSYQLGAWLLGSEASALEGNFTLTWLFENLAAISRPLLLGSVLCGWMLGTTGYIAARIIWRSKVMEKWRQRRKRRAERNK
ncbi:DUF2062 domain-containing protein [Pseudomonadales bacterium]|nr:DUF2062 domain-containing protein [Pseudomonadales bacterium]